MDELSCTFLRTVMKIHLKEVFLAVVILIAWLLSKIFCGYLAIPKPWEPLIFIGLTFLGWELVQRQYRSRKR